MTRSPPNKAIITILVLLFAAGLLGFRPMLRHLQAARETRAVLAMLATQPEPSVAPLLPSSDQMPAADRSAAEAQLTEILRQTAARQGVLIEALRPVPPAEAPIASVAITVSGDATHLLRFAEAIENRKPIVRFAPWRIADQDGGSARLTAHASALWTAKP